MSQHDDENLERMMLNFTTTGNDLIKIINKQCGLANFDNYESIKAFTIPYAIHNLALGVTLGLFAIAHAIESHGQRG